MGSGPRPHNSKAVHPSESFHVQGVALDSDDWRIPRIVAILAENGFIRNRLHVPNERHHFEYLRAFDKNYGRPASSGSGIIPAIILKELDDMDKAIIIFFSAGGEKGWALIGATVPAGARTTRSQSTANRWARLYGKAINCKTKAEWQESIAEAQALNASWVEQQKQIRS